MKNVIDFTPPQNDFVPITVQQYSPLNNALGALVMCLALGFLLMLPALVIAGYRWLL